MRVTRREFLFFCAVDDREEWAAARGTRIIPIE
jgi:hypothetical protein